MSTCAVVRSFIESKTTKVQTSNVGFTSEVSDYLVVHTGPDERNTLAQREKARERGTDMGVKGVWSVFAGRGHGWLQVDRASRLDGSIDSWTAKPAVETFGVTLICRL